MPLRLKTLVCGQGNRSFFGSPNQPFTDNARLRFLGKPKEMGTATKRQNLDSTHDEHMVAQTLCCNHLAFATGCSVGLRGLSAQIVDRTSRTHASRAISDMELVNSYLDKGYILRMRDRVTPMQTKAKQMMPGEDAGINSKREVSTRNKRMDKEVKPI